MKKSKTQSASKRKLPPEAYDRVPRVQVTLTDETAWLTRYDRQGFPTVTYPVALSNMAAAFAPVRASTGLLPADALFHQNLRGSVRLGVWLPPAVRELRFEQGRRQVAFSVPLPGFIFVGQGAHYAIFAAAERPTQLNAQLYHAPLPNVNDGGDICFGNVKFPAASAAGMAEAAKLFFESQFSGHLAEGKVRSLRGPTVAVLRDTGDDFEIEEMDVDDEDLDPFQAAHGPERRRRAPGTLFGFLRDLARSHARKFPSEELIPVCRLEDVMGGRRKR